jgi:hypothetical protein
MEKRSHLQFVLFLLTLLIGSNAQAISTTYNWGWDCSDGCANIGLSVGDSVSGWATFSGGPLASGQYYHPEDVLDYQFTLGNVTLDSGNTDIAFWLQNGGTNMFTGGDLTGLIELYDKGTTDTAFYLFDDSDTRWELNPRNHHTTYTAAGPVFDPSLYYPPGWTLGVTVPEPQSMALIGLGLFVYMFMNRRKLLARRSS